VGQAAQPPSPAAEPARPSAAALAPRPGPVLPPEPPQTSLAGAILPGGAHLRLESSTLGDLALHLRIRDGVAHLRLEGEQAPALVQHGHELQRALAAEGLKLGQLEAERPQARVSSPADGAPSAGDQGRSGLLPQGQPDLSDQSDRPGQGAPGSSAAAEHTVSPGPRRASGRSSAHHVEA
jgi:flagellar hook-length control protein FliK